MNATSFKSLFGFWPETKRPVGMSDADWFDGSTAGRARRPIHVKSLLEEGNIEVDRYPDEGADRYCAALQWYIDGAEGYNGPNALIEMWHRAGR